MANAVALPSVDYVICGGGTAGLVLANRLSEIPTVNVAVIEYGVDRSDDLNVLAPSLLTALYGNPDYDWIFQTTPQPYVNDRVIGHPRGKQLGGSSAINYLAYTHASQINIDNFEALGNANWTWDVLEPYYTKSENFTNPSNKVRSDLNTSLIVRAHHGKTGPIHNGFPREYSVLDEAWPRTYDTLGIGIKSDPRDGLALGGYNILTNLNLENNTRSYAATAYLNPIKYRPNLKVYTSALVKKVQFDVSTGTPAASSVIFNVNGTDYLIPASREVILSAGTFGSPHILELSGVGNSSIMSKYGIPCMVENPHVGENLQDHVYMPLGFRVNAGIHTLDDLIDVDYFNAAYDQYLANFTGPLSQVALGGALLSSQQIMPKKSDSNKFLALINSLIGQGNPYTNEMKAQYKIIIKDMKGEQEIAQHMNTASGMNPTFANDTTKLFTAPTPGNYFTILGVLEHPFSRGSVHLQSANASVYPVIDPRYLSHPADIKILAKIALHIQDSLAKAKPLSDLLQGNGTVLQPEYNTLTEANVEAEIRRVLQSEYHPSGTCAMLPEDQGGVVDSRLRVYGTKKLRVVDASIVPLQPRANLQTFVYAMAERAADFIKEDLAAARAAT
ncbi:hypothetical protein LTR53_002831 [Teratosphaeriaceae sp. CCFEE 6253]|nr:hypothetical protein LTR53_002831 [Teratosphaeriaceae sp. CCFEE 6253]